MTCSFWFRGQIDRGWRMPSGVSSDGSGVPHLVHGVVVLVGTIGLVGLLWPRTGTASRDLVQLQAAAVRGELVDLARRRASLRLQGTDHAPATVTRGIQCGGAPAVTAGVASLVAAMVHLVVVPEHFGEGLLLGAFFVALSGLQLAVGAALLRRPSRDAHVVASAVAAATVALWAVTRTVGLPYGVAEVEPVGILDATATVAELLTCLSSTVALTRGRPASAASSGGKHEGPRKRTLLRVGG